MIYLDDDIEGFDLHAALPMLSEQRREQLHKFKHELEKKTCAMAYMRESQRRFHLSLDDEGGCAEMERMWY